MRNLVMAGLIGGALAITACSSNPKKNVVEAGNQENRPTWATGSKITWTEGDQVYFRSQYTIRGDERVNGCYQLARIDANTTLLREIAEDIRGQIDSAQQSISENAETILNQSVTSDFSGRVSGLRFLEQYHERYIASSTERVDCYVFSAIKKADYEAIRRSVVHKITEADPGLKAALNKKQIDFFSKNGNSSVKSAENAGE